MSLEPAFRIEPLPNASRETNTTAAFALARRFGIAVVFNQDGEDVFLDATGSVWAHEASAGNVRTTQPCVARPLIYIAGPFRADTSWEIERNIRRAEEHGLWVARLGGIPVIPHTMYRFFQNSLSDTFWLEAGLALLRPCNAVAVDVDELRAEDSTGTQGEIVSARELNLPVFYAAPRSQIALQTWIANWIKEHTK